MKITVIGCGNATSMENFNQSFMLTENGKNLLIDCGGRVPLALHKLGIPVKSIDGIYVSHRHADHIGGLEEIALQRYPWQSKPQDIRGMPGVLKLYGDAEMLDDLWEHSLSGGLSTIEGVNAQAHTLFDIHRVSKNGTFEWEGWSFELIQQVHVFACNTFMPSYGLFMKHSTDKSRQKVFFTTDCQWYQPKQMDNFYKAADIIFQDCECTGCNTKDRSFTSASGVHATYAEIAGWESANARKIAAAEKGKIWLGHYQDYVLYDKDFFGNDVDWHQQAVSDGLVNGFVRVGQTFEL